MEVTSLNFIVKIFEISNTEIACVVYWRMQSKELGSKKETQRLKHFIASKLLEQGWESVLLTLGGKEKTLLDGRFFVVTSNLYLFSVSLL